VNIQTVQFAHIWEQRDLSMLHDFLSQTAFVISHKNESIETLLRVLWYIPANSTMIVVTNCPEHEHAGLRQALRTRLTDHHKTYLLHQKDVRIAHLFQAIGIPSILGADGRVRSGKGEGMYIGALCASQLGDPRWLVFYDADNFVPSALLEYTLAMARLFLPPCLPHVPCTDNTGRADSQNRPELHNVRICWACKPVVGRDPWQAGIVGRATSVVSPLFESLLEGWFGISNQPISTSNAGEQGMTVQTASSLRFSSGFSVETFQLLDLLFCASPCQISPRKTTLQQYLSQSPHFHEKKGDEHIKTMIEQSLGSFYHFEWALPHRVQRQLQHLSTDLQLARVIPQVYPRLQDVPLTSNAAWLRDYALFPYSESLATSQGRQRDPSTARSWYQGRMTTGPANRDSRLPDASLQEVLVADPPCQHPLPGE
jgi:mannosyl-3-phosphoglycerate synthase